MWNIVFKGRSAIPRHHTSQSEGRFTLPVTRFRSCDTKITEHLSCTVEKRQLKSSTLVPAAPPTWLRLTSGVSRDPPAARQGAVHDVLVVRDLRWRVGGAETVLEPLHQILH